MSLILDALAILDALVMLNSGILAVSDTRHPTYSIRLGYSSLNAKLVYIASNYFNNYCKSYSEYMSIFNSNTHLRGDAV